jgi:caa(3)-type oxidase subunit IV
MSQLEHHSHGHHITPIWVLARTFAILIVLMALTIVAAKAPYWFDSLAPYRGLWVVTNAIALGIATAKAVLVVREFMGVKYATNLIKVYAIGGFVWFTLLFIMFVDYASRPWEPVKGWENVPSTAFPRSRDNDAGLPFPQYPGKDKHGKGGH